MGLPFLSGPLGKSMLRMDVVCLEISGVEVKQLRDEARIRMVMGLSWLSINLGDAGWLSGGRMSSARSIY